MKKGECIICGAQTIGEKGNILPNYDTVVYVLSDKSLMTVVVCKDCKETKAQDFKQIMVNVRRGWQDEMDAMRWSAEQIKDYKKKYFSLEIEKVHT